MSHLYGPHDGPDPFAGPDPFSPPVGQHHTIVQNKIEPIPDFRDPDGPRPCTDLGNAERFARRHSGKAMFDIRCNKWRVWDGKRWALDDCGAVNRFAHETARSIYGEAEHAPDSRIAEALAAHARRTESRDRLQAMIAIAQNLDKMVVPSAQWDADPWLFNANNYTIDLRTGDLRKHSPTDYITKLAPVDYDPEARCAAWDKVMHDALPDDETRAFLRRAAGYSLTGVIREEVLFMILGPENSGKSSVVEAIKAAMGDYALSADFETFLRSKKDNDKGTRNDVARLAGSRMVSSAETERGRILSVDVIKKATGKNTITARFLYQEHFDFAATFKLWFESNHPPKVDDEDGAMWRRILRIPFENTIPKAQRKTSIKDSLMDPGDGGKAILAWAVRGCMEWQRQGLGSAPVIEAATEAYREDMNPLQGFFETCCVFDDPLAWTSSRDLYEAYKAWATNEDGVKAIHLLSSKSFAERLKGKGLIRCKSPDDRRGWKGVSLVGDTFDGCDSSFNKPPLYPPCIESLPGYVSDPSHPSQDDGWDCAEGS